MTSADRKASLRQKIKQLYRATIDRSRLNGFKLYKRASRQGKTLIESEKQRLKLEAMARRRQEAAKRRSG